MSAQHGYPLDWFAEAVDDSYKCGICSQVLKNPTTTKCGHMYCFHCLSSWVSRYGVCPERCRELELDTLKPTLRIHHLISGLAVHCKNKSAGCRVQVSLADKLLHEESCPYSRAGGLRKLLLSKFSLSQLDLSEERKFQVSHKRAKSSEGGSNTRINYNTVAKPKTPKRSPSSAAALCRSSPMPMSMVSKNRSS